MKNKAGKTEISAAILWEKGPVKGMLEIFNGRMGNLRVTRGQGSTSGNNFTVTSKGILRIEAVIKDARIAAGADQTMVAVRSDKASFAFFLRDVNAEFPIYISEYGTVVTTAEDKRNYGEIAAAIKAKGLLSKQAKIEAEPEETYENACRRNRNQACPTWLGLSRDMRIFRVGPEPEFGYWGYIEPCYHSIGQAVPETNNKTYSVKFCVGPGSSCRVQLTRRLEDGILPILRSTQQEDDITYNLTAFATLEKQPITLKNLRGSDWRACYPNTIGNMLTAEEFAQLKNVLQAEMHEREEEVVCCVRVEAVNSGPTPHYAWLRGLYLHPQAEGAHFDGRAGFSTLSSGRVYGINRLNGSPMPQEEMAILLQPGETTTLDLFVPHQPVSRERAEKIFEIDVSEHLVACRKFWQAKLAGAAYIHVPEPAVNERIGAGLLHCDLVALGLEPDGNVLATIGWYSPIGSESAPIIQFFDSMGWHKLAERSLNFFLDRQRPDGFIQNFASYQLETGPVLWTIGEHYRYNRDEAWIRQIQPKLIKACDYLLKWRERNKKEALRGKGYGLLDGKVADPDDFFHSFFLNGVSYLGIQRISEILTGIDSYESKRLAQEAEAFKKDIRTAFQESLERSPAVPLGDGTWVPSAPPWPEYRGPVSLYAEGGKWFTHGAFGVRDSLAGALWLIISEIIRPEETGAAFLLKSNQELFTVENAALSQPYYCRHDYAHLSRGEVKLFLKTYYNQFTALQDRETYTFWEHYFHCSQHKTHEEAWFLMQTRWMLYREEGKTLKLLSGIPRTWLKHGKRIELRKVVSYFGPVSLLVESNLKKGRIVARVECHSDRLPERVQLRIPHPDGKKACDVKGGTYDPSTEIVLLEPFTGIGEIALSF